MTQLLDDARDEAGRLQHGGTVNRTREQHASEDEACLEATDDLSGHCHISLIVV